MNDELVARAWLADVGSPVHRILLGSLAYLADRMGAGAATTATVAEAACISIRSARTHLTTLAESGWLSWTPTRSADGRHNGAAHFTLSDRFTGLDINPHAANVSASELQPDAGRRTSTCSDFGVKPQAANVDGSGLQPDIGSLRASTSFYPGRVNPAWAWRIPVESSAQRVVLGSMALLADHRGVCLAPRATIAARSLLSRPTTDRVLRALENAGWVGREARRRGARAAEARLHLTRQLLETARPVVVDMAAAESPARTRVVSHDLVNVDCEDLSSLVVAAAASDWVGESADVLATAVAEWVTDRGSWVARRRVGFELDDAIADTIGLAWSVIRECSDELIGASNPWGLLATIVGRRAAVIDETDRGIVRLGGTSGKVQGFSLADDWTLEAAPPALDEQRRGNEIGLDDLADSPVIDSLVTQLADLGVDPGLAWPVLCRCVELAMKEPQSRRHTAARRDPYLRILGLTPEAASAWMNLITGTRRAGQSASALLAHGRPLVEAVPIDWLQAIIAA